MTTEYPPATFDTTRPHSARVWNYFLGGKDNFPVDREHGDRVIAVFPEIIQVARASRAFLARAITFLAAEHGIRQFLDVGTGLPVENNTHQVAQRVAPESRVVYVDNDPLVLSHARALLVGTPEGKTAYLDADARDPERILSFAAETLDFSKPVGLMMMSIMGLVPTFDEAHSIVQRLLSALPSGSFLVLEDGCADADPEPEQVSAVEEMSEVSAVDGYGYRYRTVEQITRYFDGLDIVEPGVVSPTRWRNDPGPDDLVAPMEACGVGRKP
ncbi:SAM-dependent methyltransferase [Frankia sp. CNm7]|uniref:SAM-dependent methyltransferase n=1 Tax=Frankia nepalensis TaxID=1836974 RepID=A0A937USC2_9ACTN|nr:SAM-dependent methyltransferase [Frankia nepalensis]MBL7500974.1 SAM-dependent methyltransferase [Frankia nepalensis]MBL7512426.1 SAM-dependent methyltransferase [Frankia nepalensis]MBL7516999.1 SAM-dependent methyltransferase [Frankia nepalensis]MBL7631963.1 SAM-dependent methyltransferase [Frankia nepalensis]